jgi:hypothetical protein
MEENGENNRNVENIGRIISQTLALGPEHDKIWA